MLALSLGIFEIQDFLLDSIHNLTRYAQHIFSLNPLKLRRTLLKCDAFTLTPITYLP